MDEETLTPGFAKHLGDTITALWFKHLRPIQEKARAPGSAFYHYTSIESAFEIIRTQTIWATNVLFLNDPTELYQTTDPLQAISAARAKDNPGDAVWSRIDRVVRKYLEPIYSKEPHGVFPSLLFAASFTGLYDDEAPIHWAQYSATGSGVALGFQSNDMQVTFTNEQSPPLPCIYDDNAAAAFIDDVLMTGYRLFVDAGRAVKPEHLDAVDEHICNGLGLCLGRLAPLHKHRALHYEKEWRISRMVLNQDWTKLVKHCSANRYRPHVELDLKSMQADGIARLPLRTITLGPTVPWELVSRSLNSALAVQGYSPGSVQVLSSKLRMRRPGQAQ